MARAEKTIQTWEKRWKAGEDAKEKWEVFFRVQESYNYWRGEQLKFPMDEFGNRRAQVNKIYPDVRQNIPSLYFYRPFAILNAEPEETDDPGSELEKDTQLLQDTANHLIRNPDTWFRPSTYLALTEAHWGMGCVEVGYAADFGDAPNARKPELKETKKTDLPPVKEDPVVDKDGLSVDVEDSDNESIERELKSLKKDLKDEKFFVKFIPCKQVICSTSDKAIVEDNDWIGYWEELPLEDVKRAPGYKNTKDLKVTHKTKQEDERMKQWEMEAGEEIRIRILKIWDMRTKTRYVIAEGHRKYLLVESFKRCPLKFLRFGIDPYHFYPIPPIYHKLGSQDEYNQSREYLRKVRNGTVPRFTYDRGAVEANQMRKLERGDVGTYIPRAEGTNDPIQPIQQPTFSDNALQTLTLSDKEFADVGGVGGDAKVAQSKTATQAKISEVKNQAQDSFDRVIVGQWLAEIVKELLILSMENMNLDRFITTNVDMQNPEAGMIAQDVAQRYQRINADILADADAGIRWDVGVDVENLSPVAKEEKFQKWMQGLSFITNPMSAQLFAAAPEMLEYTLDLMGMESGKARALIANGLQAFSQMMMQQQQQAGASPGGPGVSPQPGGPTPGTPAPGPPPGGPQPGGPPGPGGSTPQ